MATDFHTALPSPILTKTGDLRRLRFKLFRQLFKVYVKRTHNPFKAFSTLKKLQEKYATTFGEPMLTKAARVDNRYYWRLATPGFPSAATYKMHENEIGRLFPDQPKAGLRTLLFAITKKCPLNCEHCFEWNNLNQEEKLSVDDITRIVHRYQDYGTTQIMFSGGEPMLRINDIYKVLAVAKPGTDFWIITSGLGFNEKHAAQLKSAGLTGVMISLDHYLEDQHNAFRGYKDAYQSALNAARYAHQIGLVTTLALCTTKKFISQENIDRYMDLALSLGVTFVQFIEPRSTGRYAGQSVELNKEEIALLEKNYLHYNSSEEKKSHPIINYIGYHQRRVGCFGAGDRFFYVDTDGDAHICPYCSRKVGSALHSDSQQLIGKLAAESCHSFSTNKAI